MKITIVSGLLGSGKTTFITRIASGATQKTVVLVNDFGKAGIDGEILSGSGIESVELPSGCICCTLRSDLISTIRRITDEYSPDHLIIEPSGIASPSGVIDAMAEIGLLQYTVVSIVDATEFVELHEAEMYGDFFRQQVALADVILINKVDLAGEDLAQKTADLVALLNPYAITYRTVKAAVEEPLPENTGERRNLPKWDTRLHFDTLSLTLQGPVDSRSVRDFFEDLSGGGYGTVVRAKAMIQTYDGPQRCDLSSRSLSHETLHLSVGYNRIVIIGERLDRNRILAAAAVRWEAQQI